VSCHNTSPSSLSNLARKLDATEERGGTEDGPAVEQLTVAVAAKLPLRLARGAPSRRPCFFAPDLAVRKRAEEGADTEEAAVEEAAAAGLRRADAVARLVSAGGRRRGPAPRRTPLLRASYLQGAPPRSAAACLSARSASASTSVRASGAGEGDGQDGERNEGDGTREKTVGPVANWRCRSPRNAVRRSEKRILKMQMHTLLEALQ
jgi:hypothetical protein